MEVDEKQVLSKGGANKHSRYTAVRHELQKAVTGRQKKKSFRQADKKSILPDWIEKLGLAICKSGEIYLNLMFQYTRILYRAHFSQKKGTAMQPSLGGSEDPDIYLMRRHALEQFWLEYW